jgi:hypothetical protein
VNGHNRENEKMSDLRKELEEYAESTGESVFDIIGRCKLAAAFNEDNSLFGELCNISKKLKSEASK